MDTDSSSSYETNSARLDRLVAGNALTLGLVSAMAGDRTLLDPEKIFVEDIHNKRGKMFFSDILFLITHQYFPPEVAEDVWGRILSHKFNLSRELSRNVKLVVAALDYLSNSTSEMKDVTLITEADVGDIIRLSQYDNLTGLFNHAHLYQNLDMQVGYYTRYGTPVTLLIIDIDDFKKFNDKYGHQEGDVLLSLLGTLLLQSTRDVDICCRYGGDEFALILPLSDIKAADIVAKRIQSKLSFMSARYRVTVSMGASACGKNANTVVSLVKKADEALYQAKRKGKNQIVINA
ncbi:MAG: GGDEF domain-containing protein [Elusimicrobiales bacterium]